MLREPALTLQIPAIIHSQAQVLQIPAKAKIAGLVLQIPAVGVPSRYCYKSRHGAVRPPLVLQIPAVEVAQPLHLGKCYKFRLWGYTQRPPAPKCYIFR